MKIAITVACTALFLVGVMLTPNAFAENVPSWIKNNAGWWAGGQIDDGTFISGIQYLIKEGIMIISPTETSDSSNSQEIPSWVKNTAGWWATDVISETEFVNAIAYLIKVGIINIESSKSPELIAEMWVNGHINDDEFLRNVEQLIEKDIITIQSDSITNMSDLPDWLVNNAGWWAARIFTNSDFSFDPAYVDEELYPCIELSHSNVSCLTPTYNSYGFRGNEFQEQKHDIDFRIFTVGGSTTFGKGSPDDETWPVYLQQIINEKITGKKIEIINAGIRGADTTDEYNLVKNMISSLDPDLIIMFDGWNERWVPIEKTIQNWESICKLGKNEGFDVIIIVQPLVTIGKRVLTDQEITNGARNFAYLQTSQPYVDAFEKLDKVCTKTADFRTIFDYVQEPIFYDSGHTMSFGNKVIAENVFSVISPIYFGQTYSVIHSDLQIENNELETGVVYAVGADLSGKNFDNLNLQNAVFDTADLSNTSFKNANINGARFVFANLDNSNLLDRTELSNINLAGTDLSNLNLKGKNLSGSMLTGADLTGTILIGANLSDVNLSNVDLSKHDLSGTNLSDSILFLTNLSGMDLRSTILDNANFSNAILSESKLPDSVLVNNNFDYAYLMNINFAGKDLSGSSFQQVKLEGSDMQNTNLSEANFIQVNFTKIKNKSLAEADLTRASLAHSNLSGVNLDNIIIIATNFWKADLSGVDFSVISNALIQGSTFIKSNLSNSNFEGIDLSPKQQYTATFKNKAYLIYGVTDEIEIESTVKQELFGEINVVKIISIKVSGNDLDVDYIFINNFANANLDNANFKNAKLWNTNFYSANLTNADFTGADLRSAFLSGADLSNANLSGADLSGAFIDESTIVKCINHPICLD